jgi:hypothetical protein
VPTNLPKKSKADAHEKDFLPNQERMASQFSEFKSALLRLAQRLEHSPRTEDKERAVVLKEAIRKAGEVNPELKFDAIVNHLKANKLELDQMKEVMELSSTAADDIRTIINILLAGNKDAMTKEEIRRLEALIKALDKAIRDEQVLRAQNESGAMKKDSLAKAQQKNKEFTESIAKAMSKPGEQNPSQNNAKGKSGQGKGSKSTPGEAEETKPGKPSNSNPNNLPAPKETPGRKQVQDSAGNMQRAKENIEKEKPEPASEEQTQAIEKLQEVRKKLEELLRQLREEELQRLLAALQGRCQRMLAMQKAVYEGTVRLDKAIAESPDKKAQRGDEQRSLQLSDQEMEIVKEADKCIQLLETEGSGVAFPEVFHQVRDDMLNVQRRLGKADVFEVTQGIEKDIIATLEEMIEALKKAQSAGSSKSSSKQGPKSLIDLLAELKMVRALQVRVNSRTQTYGRQYPGEQANDPDIQKELTNLAERQLRIFEMTDKIAKKQAAPDR